MESENEGMRDQRERAKSYLAEKFGIGSAFVRVPTLSKILGLAPPTIYASIREGRFCMPHRHLGSVPVVKMDDLAGWYCQAGERPRPKPEPDGEAVARSLARKHRERANADLLVAEVFAEMGVSRRRRRPPRAGAL
ncbi:hypothetical protein [Rugamonas aquatica]|uniref:Uncharacterized protein n=1 Tax=Rugamonas aquatica TaxID=2743357 RepID=A0A6A7NCQ6_9BURK|nr:hypothetical protein [Rugamonas aquatica]MQA42147.1 hypothetical protein [Rugamonas aquatica]